jgi:hypothetical protein
VIADRVSRLDTASHEALALASAEGQVFTAEVVARVQAVQLCAMCYVVPQLSTELNRRHGIVHAEGVVTTAGQQLTRYRFRHIPFSAVRVSAADAAERAYLHEDVNRVVETAHGEGVAAIAPSLARHFEEAAIRDKAVAYLLKAGEQAARLRCRA